MALKLFEHPLSPYARKLKLVIYEKGIPIQRVYVNPNAKSDEPSFQEFVMASPRLEVPVLADGDLRVFDSTIALEYLEERWPRPPMMPDKPADFFLAPDDVAVTVAHLVEQPKSAWTFELDVRPHGEKW